MDDICTGCLCSGRKLTFISETAFYDFYSQILNEIPVQDMSQVSIRICWECSAMLQKFDLFKKQVKRCYTELLWNIPTPYPSHLTAVEVYNISYPDVDGTMIQEAVKEECIHSDFDIKSEAEECTEHQEPETFVNDLKVEGKNDERVKKTKKKPKEKKGTKNKIKVKKKKSKAKVVVPVPVDDDISNSDLPLEDAFQEDAEDRSEECMKEGESSMLDVEVEIEKMDNEPLKVVKPNGHLPVRVVKVPSELLPEKPQCVECGKIFSSRKTYRYHMNVLHKGNNRYPCPRCGKVYQWKSNLGRHMRTHKAVDAGELYCDPCDKSFASVATYRQHLRISRRHVSENEFGFTCNECGKKFVNKTRLRDHIDWDHLKKIKFRCQQCNKPFKCHTSLYVHLQNVHRNKEKKDNLCHVCGKSYQNAAKLKYHIVALHTGETPYQCAQCAAAFGWYSSLYRHIREVHYKVKTQPKKAKKSKKLENEPTGYMNFHP